MSDVVIVASAFGVDAIRRDGHEAWLKAAAQAGAAGFEVRRELFASEEQARLPALGSLGRSIEALGMWSVYSTPAKLYSVTGLLNEAALRLAIEEADALGARFVKLQLGGFAGGVAGEGEHAGEGAVQNDTHSARIKTCLSDASARLVVENGQLTQGGLINQFTGLFDALRAEGHADVLGMTFDIGNWQWPGESPVEAARKLAKHVEYIHCKAVTGDDARRFAVAPAEDDPICAAVMKILPRDVPRGIEFPFEPNRQAADAGHYVRWLADA